MSVALGCTCGSLPSRFRFSAVSITLHAVKARHYATGPVKRKSKAPAYDANKWKPKIGLEMHVQLKGNLKLFSHAALPGTLPVLQPQAVTTALLACLALRSTINPRSTFDRKHYFYPDLPAGYQITQKYSPLAKDGYLRVVYEGNDYNVRIQQIQLEQDTAKSFHDSSLDKTLVDLNRAGAALIEIVTEPDLESPQDAAQFLRAMQSMLRHVGASDANMEKGQMRCDANVSVRHVRNPVGGVRCEIKNLNSARHVEVALESEIARHVAAYEAGEAIEQATRGFDEATGATYHLRSKEDAPDYRYMPDPDLGPVVISPETIERLKASLPELPLIASERLVRAYGIRRREANIIVALGESLEGVPADFGIKFYERTAKHCTPKPALKWMVNELLGRLNENGLTLVSSPVTPDQLGKLIKVMELKKLTSTQGKDKLSQAIQGTIENFDAYLDEQLAQDDEVVVGMDDELERICLEVVEDLTEEVAKVRMGQLNVLNRLVGEVMKRTAGRADAQRVAKYLQGVLLPQ